MEIKQLITFKHAAENLNFTQTAKLLNFAQSSVTAQIKALEDEIGKPLFERLGKRLILTEAGHQFKRYAEKMINLSEEAITAANGEEELTGTLTIGAQESQCTYRLPPILKEFKAAFPKVKLVFKPANSDEMARKHLMEGLLDVAFIMDERKPEGSLIVEQLIKEELKLVITPSQPKSAFSIDDLKHETLLLTEAGCSYRNMFEESLNSFGIYPLDKIEFASIEAIKQCVIAGLGVALLPEMVVKKDIKEGRLKELPWKSSSSPLYTQIAWHKDKWMTPPLNEFISLTRKMFLSDI
ncbi:LysR family transcriptional regulator [Pseudobacillus badius]|uniref:LysR family transcriptional regulator n=1 Tax=Bacillus badius TaxID=1455 RepID=UPI0007B057FD|nr:LysR family transcriptional regulator [Bacillus badius]KZO00626.1 LysR family transcriptional regulator [Bacillus badius]OCS87867.1 LysR family transcriptional regulator [Bacillus badius]OVE47178.1 LysR family transcriptional regulator [Bacillus badius]TDV98974.1 DNA-binding transcriptional LysR family regulator [Bacillus badius]